MNKLTIFWNDKGTAHFNWWVTDRSELAESAIPSLESHEILKADLACMAELAVGRKVELVVSSHDVHFNQVNIPGKAQRHLRKAIPYLLEEQLADSVDELFMAFGTKLPSGDIPVRAIELNYLKRIVEQFAEAEVKLDSVVTDLDLLETPEEGTLVVLKEGQVLVNDSKVGAWQCEQQDFSWLIQKQLNDVQEDDEMPIAIPMKVIAEEEEQYQFFEQNLPAGRFAPLSALVDSVYAYLSGYRIKPINMLQGEFEPKAESSPLKDMLLKVASVAGIVLAAHLIYQGSQWFSLKAESEYLLKERNALWKQAFPGRKVTSSPLRSMQSFLRGLGQGQANGGFLNLLKSTTGLITDLNLIYPTNISYNSARNELRMDIIAKDLRTLNSYRDELKSSGHEVDMSSATQRGEGYSSRLIIRR
ncbi:hypothetical protein FLL45_13770 [Aliikangiella marina]|uniref:Type II secretion system protein L n=1 Tax=Aliikangiella marina TaxID=1712262 RepID=A0A545T9N4_9GAMM|nr:type II secretion system protein GspL [Aliikangiella marina]TQV73926.1 hypothetical protein FLL45_13770 [Aliikangiella marina]